MNVTLGVRADIILVKHMSCSIWKFQFEQDNSELLIKEIV